MHESRYADCYSGVVRVACNSRLISARKLAITA